jgi:hypothetical protein
VLVLLERVNEAQRLAAREMRESQMNPKGKKRKRLGGKAEGDDNDGEEMEDPEVYNHKKVIVKSTSAPTSKSKQSKSGKRSK